MGKYLIFESLYNYNLTETNLEKVKALILLSKDNYEKIRGNLLASKDSFNNDLPEMKLKSSLWKNGRQFNLKYCNIYWSFPFFVLSDMKICSDDSYFNKWFNTEILEFDNDKEALDYFNLLYAF